MSIMRIEECDTLLRYAQKIKPKWILNEPYDDECFLTLEIQLPKNYKAVKRRTLSYINTTPYADADFVRVHLYAKKKGGTATQGKGSK